MEQKKLTVNVTDQMNARLQEMSITRGITGAETMRRAIILLDWLDHCREAFGVQTLFIDREEGAQLPIPNL